jgi:MtN3 and saliva related transmembrane protein
MENDNQTFIIGLAAGACTSLSLLPQLIKMVREKKANDISLFYLLILFAGLSLWIWYGVKRKDLPVILTNVVALILNVVIILLGIRYKRRAGDRSV